VKDATKATMINAEMDEMGLSRAESKVEAVTKS
jgi:hypothetical protein